MPMYEFDCPGCGQPFEELVRSAEAVKDVVCPACGSHKVHKKLSTFAPKVGGSRAASSGLSAAACGPVGT
jgi:putative FmdB family regulatory protein